MTDSATSSPLLLSRLPRPPHPFALGARLLLAYAPLMWLEQRYGHDFVNAALPMFWAVLTELDDLGRVQSILLTTQGADTVVRLNARLLQAIQINGRAIDPGRYLFMSTVGTGLILQPGIIALGLVLAWPARRIAEYPLRLAMAMLLLALLLVADTPFSLWAAYLHTLDPAPSVLWWWEEFLVNGGRLMLGLGIALGAIVFATVRTARGRGQ